MGKVITITPRRKDHDPLPPPLIWNCPSCGFIHNTSDLLRADGGNLLCKGCGHLFVDCGAEG